MRVRVWICRNEKNETDYKAAPTEVRPYARHNVALGAENYHVMNHVPKTMARAISLISMFIAMRNIIAE